MKEISSKTLAIIPARGGSKGIPRKNIKNFAGKPLIAWTIETAQKSLAFDRICVATDDKEISDIAKGLGIEVPFLLPPELTQDDSSILRVIAYVLEWFEKNSGQKYEYAVLLEPTNPLRTVNHIKESLEMLSGSNADSVVSVSRVPGHFNPHWQFTIEQGGELTIFTGEGIRDIVPRRQHLPATYYRDGAIYAFKTNLLFSDKPSIYGERALAYVIDEKYTIDIDEPGDWDFAEKKKVDIHKV